MPIAIIDRFEAGEVLNESDRIELREAILRNDESEYLGLAIITFFEAFPCENEVLAHVRRILESDPQPNVTAACLKAVIEYCAEGIEQSLNYTRPFVDFSRLDEWTDEVIFSSNFFRRNVSVLSPFDRKRLERLIEDASAGGAPELVNLLT